MRRTAVIAVLALCLGLPAVWTSCSHEVTEANLTMPVPEPCQPDVINFQTQIRPIITSTCAIPGCHDNQTPAAYIDLSDYDAVMASKVLGESIVIPGDPTNSPMMRAILGLDLLFMPPLYNYQLTGPQKQLIRKWIEQGARNDMPCVDLSCDTTRFDWATTIRPIIDTYCRGCHYADYPAAGIAFDFHSQVQDEALNGLLYESIAGIAPARAMPLDQPMPDCKITQIRKWIENGAPRD